MMIDYKGDYYKDDGVMVEIATEVIFIWIKAFMLAVKMWY